jgi:hypothetical protein
VPGNSSGTGRHDGTRFIAGFLMVRGGRAPVRRVRASLGRCAGAWPRGWRAVRRAGQAAHSRHPRRRGAAGRPLTRRCPTSPPLAGVGVARAAGTSMYFCVSRDEGRALRLAPLTGLPLVELLLTGWPLSARWQRAARIPSRCRSWWRRSAS